MKPAPFLLERFYAAHEFSTRFMLGSSDCESWSIQQILGLDPAASSQFQNHWLGYTESLGAPTLRAEIARIYETLHPNQILVHAGAQEAITIYMQAVLNPGDHVVVQTPCYQSLEELPRTLGCNTTPWPMQYAAGRWTLPIETLEPLLRPDTKLIVLNTPHNPTGHNLTPAGQSHLIRLAQQSNARIFADEVYRELEYSPTHRLPAFCDRYPLATSLGVMSKAYGLPGLRIGWAATHDAAALHAMAELKDYTTICNSAPSEFLAELALRHREILVARNLQIIDDNLPLLDAFFARHPQTFEPWTRPAAGPIAFPRLQPPASSGAFCQSAIEKAGVLLLPGSVYGEPRHVRIGFGRRNLPEALSALDAHLTSD